MLGVYRGQWGVLKVFWVSTLRFLTIYRHTIAVILTTFFEFISGENYDVAKSTTTATTTPTMTTATTTTTTATTRNIATPTRPTTTTATTTTTTKDDGEDDTDDDGDDDHDDNDVKHDDDAITSPNYFIYCFL